MPRASTKKTSEGADGAADGEYLHSQQYWDERYVKDGKDEVFEWYADYETVQQLLEMYLAPRLRMYPTGARACVLGCGNSDLSARLEEDYSFAEVNSVDFSPTVVQQMKAKFGEGKRGALTWAVADVRKMDKEADGAFLVTVDKGTLDSLLIGPTPGDDVPPMFAEISRLLAPGGVHVMISHLDPDESIEWMVEHVMPQLDESCRWTISMHSLEDGGDDSPHVYAFERGRPLRSSTMDQNERIAISHHLH